MAVGDDVTLRASFRRSPVRTSVLTVLPVFVAVVQLANSLLTDLSVAIGVFVATAMISAAIICTRHHLARLQLETIDGEFAALEN